MVDTYKALELQQTVKRLDGEGLTEEDASIVTGLILNCLNEKGYSCTGTANLISVETSDDA